MDQTTRNSFKLEIEDALIKGASLSELLMLLYKTAVDWALMQTRGNQTQAAALLKMSRLCLGKYARGKGVPMGCRSYKER